MEFWQIVRIIRHQWKLIVVLTVVCLALSLFLNLTKVKIFESSALLRVSFSTTNPIEGVPDYETKATLFGTVQEAAISDQSLRSVAEKNGISADNIKSLRTQIKVNPVEKSEFLKINVVAPTEKQAINIANDLAKYVKQAANDRWLKQLMGYLSYNEGQLKIAQDNFDSANQAYEDAKKRYTELDTQASQDEAAQRTAQINDANKKVIDAQENYTKANSAIPKDAAAVDLAKSQLDSAQRQLESLQQAALQPTDPVKQAQRSAELNQSSGVDDALNRQKFAKAKVDELQGQIDLAKSLEAFPDLHAASVSIVDEAQTAEQQSNGLTLYVGMAVVVGLGLGVVLALIINYLDRGIYSVGAARELYKQPVIAGIPAFRGVKKGKGKKAKKGQPETALAAPSAEEVAGLPEPVMESFRMLGNSIVERHRQEIPALMMSPMRAALPTGTELASGEGHSKTETAVYSNGNTNGNGNGHQSSGLALAQLAEIQGVTYDVGGTLSPAHPLAVMVAANAAGAGKTTVVANLGTVLAEAGYRTLLVDCNRKNPALLTSFGLGDDVKGKGKKKDKDKEEQVEQAPEPGRIYNTEFPELDILPYSSLPAQASGVIRPMDLAGMLNRVAGDYQVVVCDTPALSEASDAMGLVQHFPNIIFVVDGRQPKKVQDQERLQTLTVGSATLEGIIVNWMQKR